LNNNPAQQMAAYWSVIYDLRQTIDAFFRRYPQPSKLLTLSAIVAGIVAVIPGFLSAIAFHSVGAIVLAIVLMLAVFAIVGFTFFSSQIAPFKRAYKTLEQLEFSVERVHERRCAVLEHIHNRRLSELEMRHDQFIEQVEQALQKQLADLKLAFATFINQAGFSGVAWNDPVWEQWKLQNSPSPVTRIGSLPVGAQFGLPPLPALVACPGGCNLLLKAADASKASAMLAVQALLLRLVATQPPGKVRFTLIDPAGLGQNVATILQLADPDKMRGTYQAWVDDQEIEQQLRDLTKHIRDTNQKLRSQYASLEEYNRAAGEHAEPFRILVVLDFPANFTPRAARDLLTIVQNGPHCGVSTIIVSNVKLSTKRLSQSLPDFDLHELEKAAAVITWHEQHFTWQEPEFQSCQFELDGLPQQGLVNHILQEVGRNPSIPAAIEQNPLFKDVLLNLQWRAPREKVKVWLGHPITGVEPTPLSLQRQGGSNLLILGKQEESAIGMLITAMMSLAAQCSPATTRFYVLDLSIVDPARLYVANTSPIGFATQLLPPYMERLVNRPVLRAKLPSLMREVSDVVEDRIDSGVGAASSIYLFICGLQEADDWMRQSDARRNENVVAADTLQRFLTILHKGAKLGVHTLVWCDTLSNLKKMLGDSPLEHFDNRVVFHLPSKEDSMALIGEPGAVELSQERAFLFRSEEGQLEKFRPYDRPSKEWLEWAASEIRQKGDHTK